MTTTLKVQDVLNICPHYYDIVNCEFDDSDTLTKFIIKEYQSTVFEVGNNDYGTTNRLKVLDLVVFEFIKKDDFYYHSKEILNKELEVSSLIYHNILESVIKIYKEFTFKKELLKEDDSEPRWL